VTKTKLDGYIHLCLTSQLEYIRRCFPIKIYQFTVCSVFPDFSSLLDLTHSTGADKLWTLSTFPEACMYKSQYNHHPAHFSLNHSQPSEEEEEIHVEEDHVVKHLLPTRQLQRKLTL
jgi:hypothetical protein